MQQTGPGAPRIPSPAPHPATPGSPAQRGAVKRGKPHHGRPRRRAARFAESTQPHRTCSPDENLHGCNLHARGPRAKGPPLPKPRCWPPTLAGWKVGASRWLPRCIPCSEPLPWFWKGSPRGCGFQLPASAPVYFMIPHTPSLPQALRLRKLSPSCFRCLSACLREQVSFPERKAAMTVCLRGQPCGGTTQERV